ncbi:hypothetical protein Y697_10965 [Mesotoga sp. BH458_6_3_2_1]|nr:hypothetical protein Y697_10965 [Mesotoga sp. BH458_6_3_2_1]
MNAFYFHESIFYSLPPIRGGFYFFSLMIPAYIPLLRMESRGCSLRITIEKVIDALVREDGKLL